MKFEETGLDGAWVLSLEKYTDNRGFFARSFCQKEFQDHHLNPKIAQCNVSYNEKRGTLRGIHYQIPPYEEAKLVMCTSGAIFDVIIDIRKTSSTYGQTFSIELNEQNRKSLYIPEGFAHGFQTLSDHTVVFYQMSQMYQPNFAAGILWNDPALSIEWPLASPILSERDQTYDFWEK